MRTAGAVAAALITLLLALITTLFVVDRPRLTARPDAALASAIAAIDPREVRAHLTFLASDLLEGRAPSTRGGLLAAEYLAAQLASYGYLPAGDEGTYFQQVPLVESLVLPSSRVAIDGRPLEAGIDVVAFSPRVDARVEVAADVVFVGYGIVAPEYGWDDYAGANVAGRVVLALVNEPRATPDEPNLFAGEALSYYGRWTYKFEEAARQGAVGVVLVHTEASASYPWQVVQASWGGVQYALPPSGDAPLSLQAWVTEGAASAMVASGGHDFEALRRGAGARGHRPTPLGVRLTAVLERRVERRSAPNVVGWLPGADPSDGVVITAHYDHLGVGPAVPGEGPEVDRIFNGALDNASGVAGTLAVARALSRTGEVPRRSVHVLFTTAEEFGLLGSEYFIRKSPRPAARWAAGVNIDEINLFGPARDFVLIGGERSSIGELARRLARARGRVMVADPEAAQGAFFRSDHFSLARAGVPAVSIGLPSDFTGPSREAARRLRAEFGDRHYHQPSDEVQADWNFDAAVEDLRLAAELVWRMATDEQRPAWTPGDPFAQPRP